MQGPEGLDKEWTVMVLGAGVGAVVRVESGSWDLEGLKLRV